MTIRKHLITLEDLSNNDLNQIVSRGVEFATGKAAPNQILAGNIIGIYFRKTSTRTRSAFSVAALRMGAQIVSYGPNDLQENTGESIEDTTQVLSRMLDGFVARTAGSQREMETFASQNRMSVINAMSAEEHPTQALTDLTTMKQHFGEISGLRILYMGEGNNSAAALALALSRFPNTELYLFTPPGYGVAPGVLQKAQKYAQISGSKVIECHDIRMLPSEVDVVYTTRWQTTGTAKADPLWKNVFYPFAVTQEIIDLYSKAIFMHDLPAHRGEEVAATVIDGSKSIVFTQAENKLNSAMAALEWCLVSQN
ncbi:ornithine carbamoyltransferase (plasmid) [Bacillus cereus]|uniref:ornithine carbamoyltransferase n=1 Tax=Bacillus cereus TaxID=1396 RepID=UPI003DA99987